MPCDSTTDLDNLEIFSSILSDVKSKCFELSQIHYVVLGGDFNTDMSRTGSLHTNALMSYVNDEGLAFCAQSHISDIKYTHESDVHNTCSTIDHFIVSDNLLDSITEYMSVHDGDNKSDHSPVMCHIDFNTSSVSNCNVFLLLMSPDILGHDIVVICDGSK